MSEKRMFSSKIVDSDAFLDMPQTSQNLYFHLAMRADDDGFVGNPKKIIRMLGASDDDYKILIVKRFVIVFKSGVCVIKHWIIHNALRLDRKKDTQYVDEMKSLKIKENKAYTEMSVKCPSNVRQMSAQSSIDQISIDKVSVEKNTIPEENQNAVLIGKLIEKFIEVNPACSKMYGNKTQRQACNDLIETYGFEEVQNCIVNVLPKTNGTEYFPTITTPVQLRDKWVSLKSAVSKKRNKQVEIVT